MCSTFWSFSHGVYTRNFFNVCENTDELNASSKRFHSNVPFWFLGFFFARRPRLEKLLHRQEQIAELQSYRVIAFVRFHVAILAKSSMFRADFPFSSTCWPEKIIGELNSYLLKICAIKRKSNILGFKVRSL